MFVYDKNKDTPFCIGSILYGTSVGGQSSRKLERLQERALRAVFNNKSATSTTSTKLIHKGECYRVDCAGGIT